MDCWPHWMMMSFRWASLAATASPPARSQEAFTPMQPSCRSCKVLLDGISDRGPPLPLRLAVMLCGAMFVF
uniref:Putative secreted protein n=1 Tax=Anopheles darlingi TaxID=43151 RepID=A0A2M4DJ37_ANODA